MKRYSSYKDSAIEWIGKIPSDWQIKKIKYSDEVIMGQSPSSDDYNENGNGLPFLQGNAEFGYLHPVPKVWCETANKIAIINDVLLSVRAPIGAVNIADQKYGIGRGLCAIRAVQSNYKYLYYFFLIANQALNGLGTGSTFFGISLDQINNIHILIPNSSVQAKIACYLDHKLKDIDSLISKKQKIIHLLKEESSAIINQAVTKGIDPQVKLKESYIEWIGKIPEHWRVDKIRHLFNHIKQVAPIGNNEKLISLYTETGVDLRENLEQRGNKSTTTDNYWLVKKEDIIVNKLLAWMGAVGISEYEGVTSPAYDVIRVMDRNKLNPYYYNYLFRLKNMSIEFKRFSKGIVTIQVG
jgi:type I restriction enzyme, S subunit